MYAQGGESTVYLKADGLNVVKEIDLSYYVEPHLALDRIVLHNAYVGLEAPLDIIGFGRSSEGRFVIMVEQPFIQGKTVSLDEIYDFVTAMGFKLYRHRTEYTNGEILLNDVHDENVLKTPDGHYVIIDADFRLNTSNYGFLANSNRRDIYKTWLNSERGRQQRGSDLYYACSKA